MKFYVKRNAAALQVVCVVVVQVTMSPSHLGVGGSPLYVTACVALLLLVISISFVSDQRARKFTAPI